MIFGEQSRQGANGMRLFSTEIIRSIAVSSTIWFSLIAITAQTPTSRIVSAANHFLSTLNEQQRQTVLFAFDDEQQRARWSNFPTGFVPRGGISLKEMNPTQRAAAMALVSSALSRKGFEKVEQIMEGDEILKTTDTGPPPFGGRGGPPPPGDRSNQPPPGNGPNRPPFGGPPGGAMFGKDLYYISILGKPSGIEIITLYQGAAPAPQQINSLPWLLTARWPKPAVAGSAPAVNLRRLDPTFLCEVCYRGQWFLP